MSLIFDVIIKVSTFIDTHLVLSLALLLVLSGALLVVLGLALLLVLSLALLLVTGGALLVGLAVVRSGLGDALGRALGRAVALGDGVGGDGRQQDLKATLESDIITLFPSWLVYLIGSNAPQQWKPKTSCLLAEST